MGSDDHGPVGIATGGLGDHVDALAELLEDLGLDPRHRAGVGQVDADGEARTDAGMWMPSTPSGRLSGTAVRPG